MPVEANDGKNMRPSANHSMNQIIMDSCLGVVLIPWFTYVESLADPEQVLQVRFSDVCHLICTLILDQLFRKHFKPLGQNNR